jgi:CubicO group peptidase (beta-lactamase class C family)
MKHQPLWITNFIGLVIVLLVGCVGSKLAPTTLPPATPTSPPTTFSSVTPTPPQTEWPTHGWQTSIPEQQGMDSQKLAEMLDYIVRRKLNLHSLLIVRNGYLITEVYFSPYRPDTLHGIYSCTKSFASALIGIAIDKGFIRGVDQPLLSFFPDRTIANVDPRKQALTLENLLTMSSGLDWSEWGALLSDPANVGRQMLQSPDPVQFVLDRPMQTDPGKLFNYNTGGSNLLSAIVEQTTGVNTLEFARRNLFEPLGFSKVFWARAQNGMYRGGDGLMLTPRDMAKFGYLYLNRGIWDGRQIIPAAWVDASTRDHISTERQAYAGYQYGYQWWLGWVQSPGFFAASGYGGQYIFDIPEKNLVVVFTGELSGSNYDNFVPKALAETYILPAVKSENPLPANPEATGRLATLIQTVSQPHPQPVSTLPAVAAQVSGKTYVFDANERGVQSFSLVFAEGADEAHLFWQVNDRAMDLLVGLDDVFRLTELGPLETAALAEGEGMSVKAPDYSAFTTSVKGGWRSENTFQTSFQVLGYSFSTWKNFTFVQGGVDVSMTNLIDNSVVTLHARPQSP